ncbi:hypothetical protein TYRP_015815 [Tyrophagus putrescentiae]|nr:hypothetical protein TYRP_015815 [Tyrophagus putrescentiae]
MPVMLLLPLIDSFHFVFCFKATCAQLCQLSSRLQFHSSKPLESSTAPFKAADAGTTAFTATSFINSSNSKLLS